MANVKKHEEIARQIAQESLKVLNGLDNESMAEPFRSLFSQFKALCGDALGKLPAAEDPDWNACHLSGLLNSLASAISVISSLNSACAALEKKVANAPAEIDKLLAERLPGEIEKAIAAKTAAGDLVEKTTLNSMCDAAKIKGIEEGAAKAKADADAALAREKLAAERKEALTKNGLPLPADNILVLPEDEFKKAQDAAATRSEALAKHGLPRNNPEFAKVWASEADYTTLVNLMEAIPAFRKNTPDPMAAAAGAPPATETKAAKIALI